MLFRSVAIGKAGATNAGFLAAQIIAVNDPALRARLLQTRAEKADSIRAKNVDL